MTSTWGATCNVDLCSQHACTCICKYTCVNTHAPLCTHPHTWTHRHLTDKQTYCEHPNFEGFYLVPTQPSRHFASCLWVIMLPNVWYFRAVEQKPTPPHWTGQLNLLSLAQAWHMSWYYYWLSVTCPSQARVFEQLPPLWWHRFAMILEPCGHGA